MNLQSWRQDKTYEKYGSQVDPGANSTVPGSKRSSGAEDIELTQIPRGKLIQDGNTLYLGMNGLSLAY